MSMKKFVQHIVKSSRGRDKGTTMIEVLAAMIILAIGVLGLAPLMTLSINGNQFASQVTTVVARSQQRIEGLVGRGGYGTMPFRSVETYDDKFTSTTTVTDNTTDGSIPAKIYQIDIVVEWIDDAGVTRSLSFTDYSPKP